MSTQAKSKEFADKQSQTITTVEECKEFLVHTVQTLRQQQQIQAGDQVSLYVTDAPIIHSTIAEYETAIKKEANLEDVVQVNIKAGNPMPKSLAHKDTIIGEDEVTIAIA